MAKTKQKENEILTLEIKPRNIFGRKLKKLRLDGIVPGNVYGPEFKSRAVSVSFKDFIKVYKIVKETGVIYLNLNGQKLPALVKNIQKHPVNDTILHVDFRKIDLTKKIETEVPIKIVGESQAVKELGGVLLTQLESILIEALPQNIPSSIEVDVSPLKEIGQEIKVADLFKSKNYEIKTPSEKVIVSVVAHKEESIAPETTTTTPEVITEDKTEKEAETSEEKVPQQTNQPKKTS